MYLFLGKSQQVLHTRFAKFRFRKTLQVLAGLMGTFCDLPYSGVLIDDIWAKMFALANIQIPSSLKWVVIDWAWVGLHITGGILPAPACAFRSLLTHGSVVLFIQKVCLNNELLLPTFCAKKKRKCFTDLTVFWCLQGNLSELGKLLMQGSFNVWTDHKRGHSKVNSHTPVLPVLNIALWMSCRLP